MEPAEYELIKSKRHKNDLLVHDNKLYSSNKVTTAATYWRCIADLCTGRLILRKNMNIVRVTSPHTCNTTKSEVTARIAESRLLEVILLF